jgi:hypothetical protein
MLSGLTTQAAFTPPFSTDVVATPNPVGMSGQGGGNPTAVFLSNSDASFLLAIYLGTSQVCIYSLGTSPSCESQVNLNEQYSIQLDVTLAQVTVTVRGSNGESPYVYNAQLGNANDMGLYLSVGTFAGEIPGEISRSSYTDSSLFSYIGIYSSYLRTLTTTVDTTFAGSTALSNGAFVNATNIALSKSYTGTTNSDGQVAFQGIITGTYMITASQSDPSLGETFSNSTLVVVGTPADPSSTNTAATVDISVPPLQPLRVSIAATSPTQGLSTLSVNFEAAPYGWTGNYLVNWYVNGQLETSSCGSTLKGATATICFSSDQESAYEVSAEVTSSGSWFGQSENTQQAASNQIPVTVVNSPYWADIVPTGDNQKISLVTGPQYNGEQGEVRFSENGVSLSAGVENDLSGITIPDWLQAILGISYPWYGVNIYHTDSSGTTTVSYTNTMEQLDSTATLSSALLPSGAPASNSALTGYQFSLKLDPGSEWAALANVVTIALGVINVIGAIPSDEVPGIVDALVSLLESLTVGEGSSLAIALASGNPVDILGQAISVGEQFLGGLLQTLPSIFESLGLDDLAKSLAQKVMPFWAIADFGFDLGALIGAGIGADLGYTTQEFQIDGLTPSLLVTTTSDSPLAYVTLTSGNGIVGWNGGWQGASGAFDHSTVVNGSYSFAVPQGSYTLEVASPAGVSQTDFTVSVALGNATRSINGTVQAGSPRYYLLRSSGSEVTLTSRPAESAIPTFLIALAAVAGITVLGLVFFLRRRGRGGLGVTTEASPKSTRQETTPRAHRRRGP